MELKINEYHVAFDVEGAVNTLLNMDARDVISVEAYMLNPILRILETINRSVIIKTIYHPEPNGGTGQKAKYELRIVPKNVDWTPIMWSVDLKENPNYKGAKTNSNSWDTAISKENVNALVTELKIPADRVYGHGKTTNENITINIGELKGSQDDAKKFASTISQELAKKGIR